MHLRSSRSLAQRSWAGQQEEGNTAAEASVGALDVLEVGLGACKEAAGRVVAVGTLAARPAATSVDRLKVGKLALERVNWAQLATRQVHGGHARQPEEGTLVRQFVESKSGCDSHYESHCLYDPHEPCYGCHPLES